MASTSTYWGSFEFVPLPVDVQAPKNLLRLARVWFRRSGETIPLAIRFRSSLQSNVARKMFEFVLKSYAHRLWSLTFVVTNRELGTFFGANGVRFPRLQHIDLAVASNTDGSIATPPTPVQGSIDLSGFHRAPFLQHVALRILDGIHPTDLRLPWGQLAQVDLGNTPTGPNEFMKMMKELSFLKIGVFSIHFARSYADEQSTTDFRTITIPHVQRLRLRLIHPSQDARIFSKLQMPCLEGLWLEREEVEHPIRDMTLYETLLATLNAPLKHAIMAEYSFPTTTCFSPRLHHSPRVVYQKLEGVFRSANDLTSLFLCPGVFIHPLVLEKLASGDFLPSLEKLSVSSVSGWDIVWMAQDRNIASMRPESGPSSNSASALMARPVALNFLDLSVMGCGLDVGSLQKLQDAVGALLLRCGYLFRYIPITE